MAVHFIFYTHTHMQAITHTHTHTHTHSNLGLVIKTFTASNATVLSGGFVSLGVFVQGIMEHRQNAEHFKKNNIFCLILTTKSQKE